MVYQRERLTVYLLRYYTMFDSYVVIRGDAVYVCIVRTA